MFIAAAVVGALLLVTSLLFDDAMLFDDAIDGLLPESEWISGPVAGAFLGAFGIVGWMAQRGLGMPTPLAAGVGVVGGSGLAYVTFRAARALMNSPTDATPRTADLVGAEGRVVTGVRGGGVGEILVVRFGVPTKLTATAARDLPVGAQIVIVSVESPTKVVVQAAEEFWSTRGTS